MDRARHTSKLWTDLDSQERAKWEKKAQAQKLREQADSDSWHDFVEDWMQTAPAGTTESRPNKRVERTDEILNQRREEAGAAKKKKIEIQEERRRDLEEARANGSAVAKMMTPQQIQNRKMKEAYESSVRRRAFFYNEVSYLAMVNRDVFMSRFMYE